MVSVLEDNGLYMSAHTYVLLNLLKKLGKRDKMRGLRAFYPFCTTSLINSIIQDLYRIRFCYDVVQI